MKASSTLTGIDLKEMPVRVIGFMPVKGEVAAAVRLPLGDGRAETDFGLGLLVDGHLGFSLASLSTKHGEQLF